MSLQLTVWSAGFVLRQGNINKKWNRKKHPHNYNRDPAPSMLGPLFRKKKSKHKQFGSSAFCDWANNNNNNAMLLSLRPAVYEYYMFKATPKLWQTSTIFWACVRTPPTPAKHKPGNTQHCHTLAIRICWTFKASTKIHQPMALLPPGGKKCQCKLFFCLFLFSLGYIF